jgi:hypothetical protein
VRELAEHEDVSINQFIATAVAEKMSALLTLDYLELRAQRGSRSHFQSVLRREPDAPPLPGDEWPVSGATMVRERPQVPRARPAQLKRGALAFGMGRDHPEGVKLLVVVEQTASGFSAYSPDALGCIAAAASDEW